MHVRLAVLLRHGVVELERTDAGAGHQEKGDVLDILNVLLAGVLSS